MIALDSFKIPKSVFSCGNNDAFSQLKRNDNMIRRLSWLRKKCDSGNLRVKPTPEEARAWSENFKVLIDSRYGLTLFRAFLRQEFCDENMEFWLAVEDYKSSRPGKLKQKASKIHSDFIAVQSPKEVNIDIKTRSTIGDLVNSQDTNIFNQAQKKIQHLMESDAYVRFLQSDLYLDLLENDSSSYSDSG